MLSARGKKEVLRNMSYPEIVEQVRRLPFHEQLRLMEELARAMQKQAPPAAQAAEAATSMLAWQGILKPEDGRIPTDEEIKEMIVQHLMEKYA